MLNKKLRKAIAMIELIFAIVVMGITLLTIPMLISTVSKSNIAVFQQESIAMAASHTNALMTYAWDETNTDSKILYTKNILHTGTTTALLTETGRETPFAAGTRKRQFTAGASASTTLGRTTDGNATVPDTTDDVDDFIADLFDFTDINNSGVFNTTAEGEYIDTDISLKTQVVYGNDNATYDSGTGIFSFSNPFTLTAPAGTTFIKLITVDLNTSTDIEELQNKQIKLKAFMCNIGAAKPKSKVGY